MGTKTSTRVSIDLTPDVHEELVFFSEARGVSLKAYVTEALMARIEEDLEEEDRLWAKMSEEAMKEDFLSVEDSEKLLQHIKNA